MIISVTSVIVWLILSCVQCLSDIALCPYYISIKLTKGGRGRLLYSSEASF